MQCADYPSGRSTDACRRVRLKPRSEPQHTLRVRQLPRRYCNLSLLLPLLSDGWFIDLRSAHPLNRDSLVLTYYFTAYVHSRASGLTLTILLFHNPRSTDTLTPVALVV